jgi:hypothetical protein
MLEHSYAGVSFLQARSISVKTVGQARVLLAATPLQGELLSVFTLIGWEAAFKMPPRCQGLSTVKVPASSTVPPL